MICAVGKDIIAQEWQLEEPKKGLLLLNQLNKYYQVISTGSEVDDTICQGDIILLMPSANSHAFEHLGDKFFSFHQSYILAVFKDK